MRFEPDLLQFILVLWCKVVVFDHVQNVLISAHVEQNDQPRSQDGGVGAVHVFLGIEKMEKVLQTGHVFGLVQGLADTNYLVKSVAYRRVVHGLWN